MNTIIKLINLQENTLKNSIKTLIIFFFSIIINYNFVYASERWIIDKNLSKISFEVPILLASNVRGFFNEFDGFVEIDLNSKINNKAIFSVNIDSINTNYKTHKTLLLSSIFFDSQKFPLSVLDTKSFNYKNENILALDVELTIKDRSKIIPINLEIVKLSEDLVQIKGELNFLRSDFNIGTGNWQNTTILKDKVNLNYNVFLFRE